MAWQLTIGLLLGTSAFVWATWGTDLSQVLSLIIGASTSFWMGTAMLFLIQQLLRAYRQQLLVQSRAPEYRYSQSLSTLCIGFFLINTLPIRLGELSRPILFNRQSNLSMGSGFALIFVERLIDLLAAMIMALLTLAYADIAFEHPWLNDIQSIAQTAAPVLIVLICCLLVGAQFLLPYTPKLLKNFVKALSELELKLMLKVVLISIVVWGMSCWMYVLAAQGFELADINYFEGMGLLAFTMIGMAPPSAPGFAGSYEAAFVVGLQVFGSSDANLNFAMAFGFHWWIYTVQSCTGIYYLAKSEHKATELLKVVLNRSSTTSEPQSIDR